MGYGKSVTPDGEEPLDMIDPERLRDALRTSDGMTREEKYKELWALFVALVRQSGGEVAVPVEAVAAERDAPTEWPLITEKDGEIRVKLVEHPPSERAQAILDGGSDWLESVSGAAVRVTAAEEDVIVFVTELAPGRWSEPRRYHATCFLREHVLAGGVPLL